MALGVKVGFKDAEKLKRFLLKNGLFAENAGLRKEKDGLTFPIKRGSENRLSSFQNAKIVDVEFEALKNDIVSDYKELLKGKLSEKEFSELPTSFDMMGDIIIMEVPHSLEKKSKLIGEALLKAHSNISTVLKKSGSHTGEFRTQKMDVIAGYRKKETIYRENNVMLKLDVEKVYFSSRLSTERKRINGLVQPGEEVLVMFSGCGPYVFNIAKNTKASHVYGVEINPIAHKYAIESKELNHAFRTTVINGDAKTIVPHIYNYIIGLKSSIDDFELWGRLKHKPSIMELHLFDDDLVKQDRIRKLEKAIMTLKKRHDFIMIHMPFRYNGRPIDLSKKDSETFGIILKLGEICKKHNIRAVVHPTYFVDSSFDEEVWLDNMRKLRPYYKYFYFENVTKGIYSKPDDVIKYSKMLGFENLCVDLAHYYITTKSNDVMEKRICEIRERFNTYFHITDSDGKRDDIMMGKGNIDFDRILPLVTKGVIEIKSKDEKHPKEMEWNYGVISSMRKKFDRILMPLPKSAGDFLETALNAIKKGGMIHFYDFLNEKDIPKKAVAKIEKACKKLGKKCKIIGCVKCGQHSPRTFRVCVDFKILN